MRVWRVTGRVTEAAAAEPGLEELSLPEGGSEEGGRVEKWTPESEGLGTGPSLTPSPSVAHIAFPGLRLLACEVGCYGGHSGGAASRTRLPLTRAPPPRR